jgi:hypothetical protein
MPVIRKARLAFCDTPRVLGCRSGFSGRSTGGQTGLEARAHPSRGWSAARRSVIERRQLVSCCGAQVNTKQLPASARLLQLASLPRFCRMRSRVTVGRPQCRCQNAGAVPVPRGEGVYRPIGALVMFRTDACGRSKAAPKACGRAQPLVLPSIVGPRQAYATLAPFLACVRRYRVTHEAGVNRSPNDLGVSGL